MTSSDPLSVVELLQRAEEFLRQQCCDSPRLDAQVLLANVLNCDRVKLFMDYAKPLTGKERDQYRTLIRRRANHEPVAYIIGTKEFWSMEFAVDPRVLIPRPDTETVVEEAINRCKGKSHLTLVDVGTGSGCLCAVLVDEIEGSTGFAVDSDHDVIELAELNFRNLGLAERVTCVHGSLLSELEHESFDLICANLPYIPSAELEHLPDDVRLFEPISALDGGSDGLDTIRMLIGSAPARLKNGGVLVLEVGKGQAREVRRMCLDAGLSAVHIGQDIAGIERVVSAIRV